MNYPHIMDVITFTPAFTFWKRNANAVHLGSQNPIFSLFRLKPADSLNNMTQPDQNQTPFGHLLNTVWTVGTKNCI